jgi:hypothetical protein
MTYTHVVPTFSGTLGRNARELCDLIRVDDESVVPVDHFRIESTSGAGDFPVGPGKYRTALLLFYWAALNERPEYYISTPMLGDLQRYHGSELIRDARHPKTEHRALHLLLGHSPAVKLTLNPGYHDHLVSRRTVEDVIRHAWARFQSIEPGSPEPLLRQAILNFSEGIELRRIEVPREGNPDAWPSDVWTSRVLTLMTRLGSER